MAVGCFYGTSLTTIVYNYIQKLDREFDLAASTSKHTQIAIMNIATF